MLVVDTVIVIVIKRFVTTIGLCAGYHMSQRLRSTEFRSGDFDVIVSR